MALRGDDQIEMLLDANSGHVGRFRGVLLHAIHPPRSSVMGRIKTRAKGVLLSAVQRGLGDVIGILGVLEVRVNSTPVVDGPNQTWAESSLVHVQFHPTLETSGIAGIRIEHFSVVLHRHQPNGGKMVRIVVGELNIKLDIESFITGQRR